MRGCLHEQPKGGSFTRVCSGAPKLAPRRRRAHWAAPGVTGRQTDGSVGSGHEICAGSTAYKLRIPLILSTPSALAFFVCFPRDASRAGNASPAQAGMAPTTPPTGDFTDSMNAKDAPRDAAEFEGAPPEKRRTASWCVLQTRLPRPGLQGRQHLHTGLSGALTRRAARRGCRWAGAVRCRARCGGGCAQQPCLAAWSGTLPGWPCLPCWTSALRAWRTGSGAIAAMLCHPHLAPAGAGRTGL